MKPALALGISACLFLAAAFFSLSLADTVYLKNGHSVEGIVKNDEGEMVELEVGVSSSVVFLKKEIEKIVKYSEDDALLRQKWQERKFRADEKIAKLQAEEASLPDAVSFTHGLSGLMVKVRLNDKVNAQMVLDTGSSLVIITKNIAAKLGINLAAIKKPQMKAQVADGRTVNVKLVTLESMEVQGITAKKVEAAVLLDDAGELGFGDGLLGMSFLRRFNFKVDQKEKKLTLEKL
jgi:clan AA aspartic protease (TIGR02281 family)